MRSTCSREQAASLATIHNTEQFLLPGPADRVFRIQVAHPHADDPKVPLMINGRTPIPVYVLDGGGTFGLFSTITRYMQWGGDLPPCLVVGIGYEDEQAAYDNDFRRYDLTPSSSSGSAEYSGNQVGGGPALRDFLTGTLVPLIEERFEVNSSNSVLYGHSLGGLFALNTMIEAPNAFRNILVLSPSLWFADHQLLKSLEERLRNSFMFAGRLATYVGEQEERIAGSPYRMTSNVLEFGRLVAEHRSSFGGVAVRVLPDESHHTILATGASLGLRFLIAPESKRSETF
jgi:predicted alpha/beta superfamily hydrolase